MPYAGLTISDKRYLLEAKRDGFDYICQREDGTLYKFYHVRESCSDIKINVNAALAQIAEMESAEKPEKKWQSADEILDEFFAEQDKKPLTWNERINQMTVEEKARFMCNYVGQCANERGKPPFKPCDKMYVLETPKDGQYRDCLKCWEDYLASPYTEGEKE